MAQDKAAGMFSFPAPLDAAANDGKTAGGFLAAARGVAGLSLEEVSAATKVKVDHLQSIEEMRPDRLPSLPYAIGFVKAYARFLGLNEAEIAARFREEIGHTGAVSLAAERSRRDDDISETDPGARIVSVVAICVIGAFVLWTVYQVLGGGRGEPAPVSAPERRVILQDTAPSPLVAAPVREDEVADRAADSAAEESISASEVANADDATADETVVEETNAPPADVTPQVVETVAETTPPIAASITSPGDDVEEVVTEASAAEVDLNTAPVERVEETPVSPPPAAPVIISAELTRSAAPSYPEQCAASAGALESVTVRFDVSARGRVANASVASSTNSCFEANALEALGRWRFSPRTVDGVARADVGKSATLNFRK